MHEHKCFKFLFSYTSSLSKDSAVSSGATYSSASTDTYLERTPKFKNGQLMEMKHIFRKHVKPKKQHEIQNLSKVSSAHVFLTIAYVLHLLSLPIVIIKFMSSTHLTYHKKFKASRI